MAQIAITIMEGTGIVATDRGTINENFTICQNAINALEDLLSTSTEGLSVGDALIRKGSQALTSNILRCEASASITGYLTVAETTTTKLLTVANGITVSTGNITLSDTSKKLIVNGGTKFGGAIEYPNFGTNFIEASNPDSFDGGNVSGTTATLTTTGVHAIMLDFSTYDGTDNTILSVKVPAPALQGQIIDVVVKIGSSEGTHVLKHDNVLNLATGDTLQFDEDYCSLRLIAVGSGWVYTGLTGVTKVEA